MGIFLLYPSTLYLGESVCGVEEGQLVPLETLDVLHHQGEVGHRLQSQLGLQTVQDVLQNVRLVICKSL